MAQGRRQMGRDSFVDEDRATPSRFYRFPILEALEELGGSGFVRDVMDRVAEKMFHLFTAADLQDIGGGRRWESMASLERAAMIKKGLLLTGSPRGYWEMTEAGKVWLKENTELGRAEDQLVCSNCAYQGGQIYRCKQCGLEYCEKCMSDDRCPECDCPDRKQT